MTNQQTIKTTMKESAKINTRPQILSTEYTLCGGTRLADLSKSGFPARLSANITIICDRFHHKLMSAGDEIEWPDDGNGPGAEVTSATSRTDDFHLETHHSETAQ
jgi:hypothetical protein